MCLLGLSVCGEGVVRSRRENKTGVASSDRPTAASANKYTSALRVRRMSMPPNMRGGYPQPQQQGQRRVAVSAADERQQAQQAQDQKLAQMLQAQEFHRAQHPSHLVHGGHHAGHQGGHHAGHIGGGAHGGHGGGIPAMMGGGGRGGLQAMLMGGGGNSGGHGGGHDAAREARHRARDEQLEMALAANPEAFVSVPMLYVNCMLNDVPLKAFVDTGAQVTVLSVKGAQRCNLLDKVDSRFRGVAAGVGAARIVGRVHMATLRFGSTTAVDVSLSVLEQSHGPELLIGLDLSTSRWVSPEALELLA